MAKTKKEQTAAGEQPAEKKAKKRKSVDPNETAQPMELGEAVAMEADSEVEKKVVLSPIAVPLADSKLKKRTLKLVKNAALSKQLKRGVKEVVKALRKGSTG